MQGKERRCTKLRENVKENERDEKSDCSLQLVITAQSRTEEERRGKRGRERRGDEGEGNENTGMGNVRAEGEIGEGNQS